MNPNLIGTREQLLAFAQSIIEAVDIAKPDGFFNVTAKVHHLSIGILDSKGETCIDEIVVVDSDEDKNEIFNNIQNS